MSPSRQCWFNAESSSLALSTCSRPVRRVGAVAPGMDGDRIALRGAEHHQSHDRRAVDPRSALFDLDRHAFGQAADEGHEFGAGARVQAALVGDFDRLALLVQGPTPSISAATEIYFCPASFAAIPAARR